MRNQLDAVTTLLRRGLGRITPRAVVSRADQIGVNVRRQLARITPRKAATYGGGAFALILVFSLVGGPGILRDQLVRLAPRTIRDLPGVREVVGVVPPSHADTVFGVSAPLSVAVTRDGEFVYVAEGTGLRVVRKISLSDGESVATLTPPGLTIAERQPVSVTVVPSGLVYVVDRLRQQVDVFDQDANWIGLLAPPPGAGWEPLSIDSDADGFLFVTSTADGGPVLLVYSPDESIIEWYPRIVAEGREVSFPSRVTVGGDGQLWLSDSNNSRIVVVTRGETIGVSYGSVGRDSLALPRGIVVDRNGLAIVADTNDHTLSAWDLASTPPSQLFRVGAPGIEDGTFQYPNDVAVDGRGWLYVADRDNNRVQIWHD
jgi:DNA-binding beta-propeller fold protein YncE